jgi:DNA repair protein RecO (recombination protein O)
MNWDDVGFLVSKNRYNENSLITEIFTKEHGKVSGIIFGGTSKKIKNYLQVGNLLYTTYNSKTVNRIGYFKIEIFKAFSPIYFDDPQKLNCISSAMNLIKILTADSQTNENVYKLINDFYKILSQNDWLKKYVFWELELLSVLGFNLDLKQMVNKEIIDNKIVYVAKSATEKK